MIDPRGGCGLGRPPGLPYHSTMLYRIARAVAEAFKFIAFGGFVLAFFVALAFVFILPIVPLFLIIASPFCLVLCWIASDLLSVTEKAVARRGLRRSTCPACFHPLERFEVEGEPIHECVQCRRIFESDGDIWQPSPDAAAARPTSAAARGGAEPGEPVQLARG